MKERPILFSAPMVRALLDGSKTQTRRVAKFKPREEEMNLNFIGMQVGYYMTDRPDSGFVLRSGSAGCWNDRTFPIHCPYGNSGDRLWVREAWAQRGAWRIPAWPDADADDAYWAGTEEVIYTAAVEKPATGWRGRPIIHMPRWASRILLEIVSVRVERLNDCSEADALAEGIDADKLAELQDSYDIVCKGTEASGRATAQSMYRELWESINGADSWATNPWVWCIEFKRVIP